MLSCFWSRSLQQLYLILFSLRIRRAALEAAMQSRKDFHTALGEFEVWLSHIETACNQLDSESHNSQLVKDSNKRRDWMDREKVTSRISWY